MINSGRTQSRSKLFFIIIWNFLAIFGLVTLLLNGIDYSEFRALSKIKTTAKKTDSVNATAKNKKGFITTKDSFTSSRQKIIDTMNVDMAEYKNKVEKCTEGELKKLGKSLQNVIAVGNGIALIDACDVNFLYTDLTPFGIKNKKIARTTLDGDEGSCENQIGLYKEKLLAELASVRTCHGNQENFDSEKITSSPLSRSASAPDKFTTSNSNNDDNSDSDCVELMKKCDIVWSVQVRKEVKPTTEIKAATTI